MARGSGAGTGVIVALVVSVVCNVGLLTITFMMYSGKTEAPEAEAQLKAEMRAFVAPGENDDAFDRIMDSAKESRQSLYSMLEQRRAEVASFVTGNANAGVAEMRTSLGLQDEEIVRETMADLRRAAHRLQQSDLEPLEPAGVEREPEQGTREPGRADRGDRGREGREGRAGVRRIPHRGRPLRAGGQRCDQRDRVEPSEADPRP